MGAVVVLACGACVLLVGALAGAVASVVSGAEEVHMSEAWMREFWAGLNGQ